MASSSGKDFLCNLVPTTCLCMNILYNANSFISSQFMLLQTLMGENLSFPRSVSKKMSLIYGARRHLEWGHEKYIMDMIQSHPAQVIQDILCSLA